MFVTDAALRALVREDNQKDTLKSKLMSFCAKFLMSELIVREITNALVISAGTKFGFARRDPRADVQWSRQSCLTDEQQHRGRGRYADQHEPDPKH